MFITRISGGVAGAAFGPRNGLCRFYQMARVSGASRLPVALAWRPATFHCRGDPNPAEVLVISRDQRRGSGREA